MRRNVVGPASHESRYFLYWAANSNAYYLYREKLREENRNFNGEHNKDDLSGQSAEYYGKIKDKK